MVRQEILDALENHYDELTILELFNITSKELVKLLDEAGWIDQYWEKLEQELSEYEGTPEE